MDKINNLEKFDYNKLGFKCGLEIHQQLNTNKLFCKCPSILRNDISDLNIKRKLHVVAGEKGEIDIAAKYQASLDKTFVYQYYSDTNCLVELDEEPPHNINQDALKIALQIALLLNCKIIPYTQIMRKTVIDGSNTSGFQRTVLIAYDGKIETSRGKVRIDSICLEEDAARIIEKSNIETVYRLDRLGIPLVEIATSPDIKSPEQAKEAALYIGDVLRSCNVKRGIGTVRQDVNMSVKNGKRIEIKGVQDPNLIIKTINSEIIRQLDLVEKEESVSEVRQALPDGNTKFLRPMPGADRMYPETDIPLLKIKKEFINSVKKNLPKLKSEIEKELKKTGLHEEMIKLVLDSEKLDDFKDLILIKKDANFIVKLIALYPKELATKNGIELEKVNEILHKDVFVEILKEIQKGKLNEGYVKHVLERVLNGVDIKTALIVEEIEEEIEEQIFKIIKNKPGLSENAYMGLVMKEFKGKISGSEAMEIIKKILNSISLNKNY